MGPWKARGRSGTPSGQKKTTCHRKISNETGLENSEKTGTLTFKEGVNRRFSNRLYSHLDGYMTLEDILIDIHSLEEELLDFERKYGVRSDIFYAAYISGEEPEDENWVLDFGEWASVFRTWLARQATYRDQVRRIQRDKPTLSGLIRVSV